MPVMLLAIGVLVLAGFVQGLTGFGFGLVAMGLLPSVLGLDQAQAVVTLASLASLLAMTGLMIGQMRRAHTRYLWIGSAIGVPFGFLIVSALPQGLLIRLLGLTIVLLVGFELTLSRGAAPGIPGWAGWCIGLTSGALSGAFNIGGPPLVAYIYGRPWPKEQQVATLTGVFLTSGIIRLALMVGSGRALAAAWAPAAWAVAPMLGAIIGGNRLLKYVSHRQLRTGVNLALLACGGRYLIIGG